MEDSSIVFDVLLMWVWTEGKYFTGSEIQIESRIATLEQIYDIAIFNRERASRQEIGVFYNCVLDALD